MERAGMVEGKVAFVTGGASGIGEAVVRLLVAEGASGVGVVDADADRVRALAGEFGGNVLGMAADVTNPDAVHAAVGATVQRFGRLDIAHNNAGISGMPAAFPDLPFEAWEQMIAINLTGIFLCMQAELRMMGEQGSGAIVNTSSGAGVVAAPGLPHYTAAKHGVIGLTKCAAQEYAQRGIRVNAVLPGSTRTPMLEGYMALDPSIEKMIARTVGRGTLGAPNEVAEAVVWLLSDRASFVSGEMMLVDGATVNR